MKLVLIILPLLVVKITFAQSHSKYPVKDAIAISGLISKWQDYWNRHEMDSMGTLLCDDVDFVNVAGQWLKGKNEAVEVHKKRHQVVFKNSVWKTDSVHVKYVEPHLAILHIGWGISGDVDPDGKTRRPRHGIFTWIVIKRSEKWFVLAVHNVNIRETGAYMNP
jgi:uncharacterized protein (TIGR02246 family)